MATWVFLHAHPDDESTGTAGTMAMAHERGDRVVLIVATDGDEGTSPDDLSPGEAVRDRRHAELMRSAATIGIDRVEWLGYADSGMTGWAQNKAPDAFCNAQLDVAAQRVAAIIDQEQADVFVHYDPHGSYGHPDHIMVHRVGEVAAGLITRPLRVLEQTIDRDMADEDPDTLASLGLGDNGFATGEALGDDGLPIGSAHDQVRWAVPLSDHVLDIKHAALACHASQSDAAMFLALPMAAFRYVFRAESYCEPANPGPYTRGWPLSG